MTQRDTASHFRKQSRPRIEIALPPKGRVMPVNPKRRSPSQHEDFNRAKWELWESWLEGERAEQFFNHAALDYIDDYEAQYERWDAEGEAAWRDRGGKRRKYEPTFGRFERSAKKLKDDSTAPKSEWTVYSDQAKRMADHHENLVHNEVSVEQLGFDAQTDEEVAAARAARKAEKTAQAQAENRAEANRLAEAVVAQRRVNRKSIAPGER